MDTVRPWKVLESRYILRRQWMDVREDRVELPTGVLIDEFHVIEYPDWVCVIPFTDDHRIVLVEQYRHGVRRSSAEFPAGVIEPGEDPVVAGQRELREETGYSAGKWVQLGSCAPEPSRHSNRAHILLARGAFRSNDPSPDESENLRVRIVPATEIPTLIERGDLIHGVHIAAVMMATLKGELEFS